jgi:ribosomal-protein-alanine N-acetyltransferase
MYNNIMRFEYTCIADEAQLLDIYVEPELRRQGLAEKKLREWFATLAPGTKVILEVRVSNHPARKLYEKLGFKELYRRKEYYSNPQEDALVMQLVL